MIIGIIRKKDRQFLQGAKYSCLAAFEKVQEQLGSDYIYNYINLSTRAVSKLVVGDTVLSGVCGDLGLGHHRKP